MNRQWPTANSPCTKARICSYCSLAWLSFTRSILFCRIRMCFNFMISIAAKCSEVWGWGHDSLPAETTGRESYAFFLGHAGKNKRNNEICLRDCTGTHREQTPTNQKECSVHHGGAVQHGGHQNVVTRAIHKGHVSNERMIGKKKKKKDSHKMSKTSIKSLMYQLTEWDLSIRQ